MKKNYDIGTAELNNRKIKPNYWEQSYITSASGSALEKYKLLKNKGRCQDTEECEEKCVRIKWMNQLNEFEMFIWVLNDEDKIEKVSIDKCQENHV